MMGVLALPLGRWGRWGWWGWCAVLSMLGVACISPLVQAQTIEGDPDAPLAARVLGVEIRTSDPDELRYWILRKLTDRYAAKQGAEATPQEIDAYIEGMARLAEKDRRQREARREDIEHRLASPRLGEAERKALSSELDSLNQLQRDLDALSGDDTKDVEATRQARRTVAAAFIRQWKINQALYQEYGGRIIFQQGGPEPLDAYRGLLEQQQREGHFEFLNKGLAAALWRYYLTDEIHSFIPPGSEEETQAFQTPWRR
jgi:hypothetical protein